MNQYPICIASKGRAGKSKTIAKLLEEGATVNLYVEPQDAEAYGRAYGGHPDMVPPPGKVVIHVLPENDQGITYVRKWILNRARELRVEWFWMLDDDISGMFRVEQGKCVKAPMVDVLRDAEELITKDPNPVAMGSLEYQQFAWSAKKPLKYNSYCEVAVLISVKNTMLINYRPDLKEDRDLVLQALSMGYCSMRTAWLAFGAPKNGSNEGGLHDAYKGGLERHWSAEMVRRWPGICTLHTKPDGRPDVKINWRAFKAPA